MNRLVLLCIFLTLAGCISSVGETTPVETTKTKPVQRGEAKPTDTAVIPTVMPEPTITPLQTATPEPTNTLTPSIMPPTLIPLPSESSEIEQATIYTVCTNNCRFSNIQDAIDRADTSEVVIIEILDPVHTEAGIVINRDVIIRGLGTEQTIVQAHGMPDEAPERVFLVKSGAIVVIENMTIRYGKPEIETEKGGGIRNFGTLTLRDCIVSENSANGGGGIANSGDLTLIDSMVKDNIAYGIGPRGQECRNGGGIQCGSGKLMLFNSTVTGNQSGVKGRARGGGIHIGCGCQAVIANSTISNNEAPREGGLTYTGGDSLGGGIYVAGELQLINSTIADNHAAGEAGGIYILEKMDYINTMIANNTGKGGNCILGGPSARIGTNISNWVEDGGCDAEHTGNPMLGPLEDNGGVTLTHALLPGSPAIDAVPAVYCSLPTDQRGAPRPVTPSDDELHCDIGAYELQP